MLCTRREARNPALTGRPRSLVKLVLGRAERS